MAKPAASSTNEFVPEVVLEILSKLDRDEERLASALGSYREQCREIREAISRTYEEAAARGIPTEELRVLVKIRRNEGKNAKIFSKLTAEQKETVSQLAAAEGTADLPLWRAAAAVNTARAEASRATMQ